MSARGPATPSRPAALLLTPVLPLPGGSGRSMRAWGWLIELARDHSVHVLVAGSLPKGWIMPADYPAASVLPLQAMIRPPSLRQRLLGVLCPPVTLLSRRFMLDWSMPRHESVGTELIDDTAPVQRIVVFRAYLHDIASELFKRFPDAERTLDMDDLESHTRYSLAAGLLRAGRAKQSAVHLAAAVQYRLVEGRLCADYAETLLASPDDATRLGRRTGRAVGCRPNRVDLPADPAPWSPANPLSLLFVGSLDYFPNEEAARQLATQLAPLLQRQPGLPIGITIAGRAAPPGLDALLRNAPGISYLPDVDTLAPLYAASRLVLVPLRSGGGTKTKVLEALAHRRAVIATGEGVRGLALTPGRHYFAAETPQQFAAAINRIVSGQWDDQSVADEGWRLCRQLYGLPAAGETAGGAGRQRAPGL